MSDVIAKRDRDLGGFVPGRSLESYRSRFAGHFALDRRDGVLIIRAHREGRSALWSRGLLNAWNLLLAEVGADRDNELIIITGTGDSWLAGAEAASFAQPVRNWHSDLIDEQYNDGIKILEGLVLDIDVPTIAAINGPGPRLELPLLCDLTVCAPDVVFGDGNFNAGSVPGDGMYLVLRELAGVKRANQVVYTGQGITRQGGRAPGHRQRGPAPGGPAAPGTRPRRPGHEKAPHHPPSDPRPGHPHLAAQPPHRTPRLLRPPTPRHDRRALPGQASGIQLA